MTAITIVLTTGMRKMYSLYSFNFFQEHKAQADRENRKAIYPKATKGQGSNCMQGNHTLGRQTAIQKKINVRQVKKSNPKPDILQPHNTQLRKQNPSTHNKPGKRNDNEH